HPERATQKPHQIWLPLELPACNEQWKDLAHQPGRILSEQCSKQLDEHLAGAGVCRRSRLLHTSTRGLDPSGQCSELLARFSARDVRLEPIGPCEAQPRERTA